MRRVVAALVVFSLSLGIAVAETAVPGSQVRPAVITGADIEAAAKAEVASDEGANGKAMTAAAGGGNTLIIILLAVLVVGLALYLIDQNDSEHGGGGIFNGSARKARAAEAPVQYAHPLLRPQFQPR